MTPDERFDRGLAAQILVDDEVVKSFFVEREKAAFERALSSAGDPEKQAEALMEVRVLRSLRNQLVIAAQSAKLAVKKKEKTNA